MDIACVGKFSRLIDLNLGAHAHVVTLPVFIGNILDFLTFSG